MQKNIDKLELQMQIQLIEIDLLYAIENIEDYVSNEIQMVEQILAEIQMVKE